MTTNRDDGRDTDPLVDPGDDTRIMQPAETGNALDGPDAADIPDSEEATSTAFTVHADDDDTQTLLPPDTPGDR